MFERVSDYFLSGGWIVDAWEIFCVPFYDFGDPLQYRTGGQSKTSMVNTLEDDAIEADEIAMRNGTYREKFKDPIPNQTPWCATKAAMNQSPDQHG